MVIYTKEEMCNDQILYNVQNYWSNQTFKISTLMWTVNLISMSQKVKNTKK